MTTPATITTRGRTMNADTVHTYPVTDLIQHDTEGGDCLCGPTTEPVPREDGSMGWHVLHHSLDGRERAERENDE